MENLTLNNHRKCQSDKISEMKTHKYQKRNISKHQINQSINHSMNKSSLK